MTKLLTTLFALATLGTAVAKEPTPALADSWQVTPQIVDTDNWHLWGASPVVDEAGTFHLYVARWPHNVNWEVGWRHRSEIAHYKATTPEGPFEYVSTVLKPEGGDRWDASGYHNPSIKRIDGKYVLVHIANDWKGGMAKHGPNQRIGMRVSDTPNGPFKKVTSDGLILGP